MSETTEIYSKRNFINLLRGIAIFLMLWGHSIQYCCGGQFDFFDNALFKVIYSFHMPLFMLISGYLFYFSEQKRGMIELIEYKAKSLLYPILMCSIFNLLITTGVHSVIGGERSTNLLGAIPITDLWFLWSVLACSMTLAFAVKLSKVSFLQGILMIAGSFFAALFPNWTFTIYMYPYFVIGYIYARNEKHLQKARFLIGIASIFIFIVMILFFNKDHYIYTTGLLGGRTKIENVYIDLFRWVIGLFGSITVIWLNSLIYIKINQWKIAKKVESLGKDSLAVYALSVSLLSFWLRMIANKVLGIMTWIKWNRYIWLYNLVITPAVAIAYSCLLLLIIKGLKKKGLYRLLFGR